MKSKKALGLPKNGSAYPNSLLMLTIAVAVSIYTLWPFPDEPFFKLISHQWFLHSFSVIFTIAVAQVWLIFVISDRLDDKYHWEKRFYHRVLGQLFIGWTTPVVVSALFNWFWFQYLQADIHSIRYVYNRYMFKAIMDIALILNLVYLSCSLGWFLKGKLKKEAKNQGMPLFADHFYLQIPDGKEEIKVQVSEIAYLYRKGKETLLRAHDGKTFIFWESLDKMEKQLDPSYFCRASRNYIISREAVKGWQKQADRSLLMDVQPKIGETIKISRDRATFVIRWIKKELEITKDSIMN